MSEGEEAGGVSACRGGLGAGALPAEDEVLAGMRPREEGLTRRLLAVPVWHAVDEDVAELAGELGRRWLPRHHTIDAADLVLAGTAQILGARLLTRNVKHFPMIPELRAPY